MNEPLTFLPSTWRSLWKLNDLRMFSRTCCREGNCAAEWLPTILRSWIQHVTVIKANNTVLIFIMRSTSETWMMREELPEKAIKVRQDLLSVQHCWWEKYFRTPKKFFVFWQKVLGFTLHTNSSSSPWIERFVDCTLLVWIGSASENKKALSIKINTRFCFLFARRQRFRRCSVGFSRAC